jgi:hypothetical protein
MDERTPPNYVQTGTGARWRADCARRDAAAWAAQLQEGILSPYVGRHRGHVDAGETFEHALLRELDEEAGIRPLVYSEHSRHPLPQDGVLVLFRRTSWAGGEPRLRNDVELRWFWIEEACTLPNLAALEYVPIFNPFDISTGARP